MQVRFDKIYRKDRVTHLEKLLFSNGFGHVWISQAADGEELSLKAVVFAND